MKSSAQKYFTWSTDVKYTVVRKYKPKELDAKRRLLDTNSALGQKAKAEPNRTEPGTHAGRRTPRRGRPAQAGHTAAKRAAMGTDSVNLGT